MFSFLKAKKPPVPTHQDLMAALKFSDADLKANRDGYMSGVQRQSLRQRQGCGGIYLGHGGVYGNHHLHADAIFSEFVGMTNNLATLLPALMFVALMGMFVWMAFKYQTQTKADLSKGQVSQLTGIVHQKTYMVYTGKVAYPVFELHFGGEVFQVSNKVYNAFVHESSYDIFYAPNTRTLLAAERIMA